MGPRLLVFGDSLSFHGPEGPCAADEPRLWPNVAAAALGGTADLVAGIGWTARDAWWSLTGDPRVWADLHHVDAVVLAVGSMDTLPSHRTSAGFDRVVAAIWQVNDRVARKVAELFYRFVADPSLS